MSLIIEQLKAAGLTGRSGSNFPTWAKWNAVAQAVAAHPERKSFVICNAAEGEPNVLKDGYILEHYPATVVAGIKIALETFGSEQAFIYLHRSYFKKFKKILQRIIGEQKLPITLFAETGGYLCGEETTLLESLEGRREEPRLRPPFPTTTGYLGYPTLVNNVETFYCIAQIAAGKYHGERFYTITGAVPHPGVFELVEQPILGKILEDTHNVPKFKYFVQAGGGASGEIFTQSEIAAPLPLFGAITVYNQEKTNPLVLMKKWINFFHAENCGKCVPCREGVLRIKNMLESGQVNLVELRALLITLKETSFCPLGKSVYYPMESLLTKIF